MKKITGKHKVYAAVLGLCGIGLALDRTMLAPSDAAGESGFDPSEAALRPAAASAAGASSAAPAFVGGADPVLPIMPASAASTLARRFDEVAESRALDLDRVGDAFSPSGRWPALTAGSTESAPLGSDAHRFRAAHRLGAVMAGETSGSAIIDGRGVRIGQEVDGFTLVEVGEGGAIFERDGVRVELTVPRPGERTGDEVR